MEDILVLVDSNDNEIGYNEKMDVHIKGQLHRAFSLFIYNKANNKLLIHKRAFEKYHSGGLWTNSCCSHPRKGERLVEAIIRRTREELGLDITCYTENLKEVGKFRYYKNFGDCVENEIDHVFVLVVDKQLTLNVNLDEIAEIQWKKVEEIAGELDNCSDEFTAWFKRAFNLFEKYIRL